LRLDRLLAGELALSEALALEAHVVACAACAARRRELAAAHSAFAHEAGPFEALGAAMTERAPRSEARGAPRSGSRQRSTVLRRVWAAATIAAALGLGVLLVVRLMLEVERPVATMEGGTRTKGEPLPSLRLLVRRAGDVFVSRPGVPLYPGDLLRFELAASASGHVAIVARDAAGGVSVYHGWAPVDAGAGQLLPGAVELDESQGRERVYAVLCARPVSIDGLVEAVRRAPDGPELPAGCVVAPHVIDKERP
jgi:hypothetical protein